MKLGSLIIAAVACVAIALTAPSAAAADAQSEGTCTNVGSDGSCSAEENDTRPPPPSRPRRHAPASAVFRNDSPYRADIHHDDGRFGQVVGTAEADGGELDISSTFVGHRFFVTQHGVREGLVEPETDEQFFFTVEREEGAFVVPKTAAPSKTKCRDRYPICVNEAARGECARNPGWMIVNCCKSCDDKEGYGPLIDSTVRCSPERLNATIPAWESGSLDALFTRWATADDFQQYKPHVVSSPGKVHGAEHDGPWIMTFDNFLNEYEIGQLLKGASFGDGFQRSTDQGKIVSGSGEMVKTVSSHRTSSNAWCRSECENLPGVRRVTKRIEEVTGVKESNYESFQILKYEPGQYYKSHHDSSDHNREKVTGHRILTFFLYLNDVEEGGETRFTKLDISVKPKKGRALVWPSVLNDDPNKSDQRMYHEAMAVVKGTKYAANHWIHQYDFRNANLWGCSGSFG